MTKLILTLSGNSTGWRGLDKLLGLLKKLLIEDEMILSNDFS